MKANEMINKAVEVLVINGMGKKHGLFSNYEELSVSDIEMLEFLTTTCPEAIETLDQQCKKFIKEYPNSVFSASYSIITTRVELDKKYHFGFMKQYPVNSLDTISNISEIPMKDRHVAYLKKLREVKPEIDAMLIEGYNQIHKELNPFRMEQCFNYLYEELESEGIKTSYPDYTKACLDISINRPYFCKSNWGYYIVDSFGGYEPYLNIYPKNEDGTGSIWNYNSSKLANSSFGSEESAKAKISQLMALNDIAGIEGLTWNIQFANRNDTYNSQNVGSYIHIEQEIPKGKITLHKKLCKEVLLLSKRGA